MAKNTANGKNRKGAPAPKNTPQAGDKDTVTDNPAQAPASQETATAAPGVERLSPEKVLDVLESSGVEVASVDGIPKAELLAKPNDTLGNERPALFVRTRARNGRRRRAGLVFTGEPYGIDLDALTAEQIAAIKADPMLVVEECSYPVDEASA